MVVVVLGVLTGCATPIGHEGSYAERDGRWRKGTVVEIGSADDLKRLSFYDSEPRRPNRKVTLSP